MNVITVMKCPLNGLKKKNPVRDLLARMKNNLMHFFFLLKVSTKTLNLIFPAFSNYIIISHDVFDLFKGTFHYTFVINHTRAAAMKPITNCN